MFVLAYVGMCFVNVEEVDFVSLLDFHKEIKGYTQDRQPGIEADMNPKPIAELDEYKAQES